MIAGCAVTRRPFCLLLSGRFPNTGLKAGRHSWPVEVLRAPFSVLSADVSRRRTGPTYGHKFSRDVTAVRWASRFVDIQTIPIKTGIPESAVGYIPEPPPRPEIPDALSLTAEPDIVLNALGEPTLQSLGLGALTPPGLVQQGLEILHVGLGIPWWASIVIGTLAIRTLLVPLVIYTQKSTVNMHNHMPTMQKLQEKFTYARVGGNSLEAAKAGHELAEFMKRNKVNPLKSLMMPIIQLPIFVSVFIGLRKMANLPVESMMTGGPLWFADLTAPDPFWLLPVLTAATLLATIEIGAEGVKSSAASSAARKWILRGLPIIILPFMLNFPSALTFYWLTSNILSLILVLILRVPRVRDYFNIPAMVKHETSALPKKGFTEGFKDSWKNSRIMAEMEDRARIDAQRFKQAGIAPVQKTYAYDPTKLKTSSSKDK